MKRILTLLLIVTVFINNGFSQSKAIDILEIKTDEIPSEYKISKKLECQAIQSRILYKNPGLYSFILGELKEKRFQTFKYKGKKGSILYFEFDKEAENGKAFIQATLWGGNRPNRAHPEKIITKGNVMIVLSFPFKSEIGETLTELISKK
ncbi:MAG: hypothetical protein JKY44_01060 [Flavobacteriaceae bacterium]|nr:hypothetical protein [Flavobacteriaceae bacterium]